MDINDLKGKRDKLQKDVEELENQLDQRIIEDITGETLKIEIAFLEEQKRLYEKYLRESER